MTSIEKVPFEGSSLEACFTDIYVNSLFTVEGKKLNPIGYRSINWTQWFQNVQGGEWAPKMMMPTPSPPHLPDFTMGLE